MKLSSHATTMEEEKQGKDEVLLNYFNFIT